MNSRTSSAKTLLRSPMPARRGPRYIIVGQSRTRRWIVKDSGERMGAVFRSAEAALRFAHREARSLDCRVVIDGGCVELECLGPLPVGMMGKRH